MQTTFFLISLIFCSICLGVNNDDLIGRINRQANQYRELKLKTARRPAVVSVQVLADDIVDLESEFSPVRNTQGKKAIKQATFNKRRRAREAQ